MTRASFVDAGNQFYLINNQPDSNAACVTAPNRFTLMLYDVINYNNVTSTICSHEYAR